MESFRKLLLDDKRRLLLLLLFCCNKNLLVVPFVFIFMVIFIGTTFCFGGCFDNEEEESAILSLNLIYVLFDLFVSNKKNAKRSLRYRTVRYCTVPFLR